LSGDDDALPPHVLYPAFYGCFDWHSDVHGHWLLVRLLRLYPDARFAAQARSELKRSFTAQNMAGELRYLQHEGRASFERPYGLAWLLQLSAELRAWNDPQAEVWAAALRPLETEAASRLKTWIPKLHYPIRIGEHSQTAFSFGLIHGLGFAGGLSDAGLPVAHIPTALLFFSLGVESGHFLFIGAVLSLLALAARVRMPLPHWAELVPPYAIGTVAMFWVIQRTVLIFGFLKAQP
jgi:hypothetical protein